MAAMMVGGAYAAGTGSIQKGLMAGISAYGGAGLGAGIASAGTSAAVEAGGQAALDQAATQAASSAGTGATAGADAADVFSGYSPTGSAAGYAGTTVGTGTAGAAGANAVSAAQNAINSQAFPNYSAEGIAGLKNAAANAANPMDVVRSAGMGNVANSAQVVSPTIGQSVSNMGNGITQLGSQQGLSAAYAGMPTGTLPALGATALDAGQKERSSVPGYQEDEYDRRLKGYKLSPDYQAYSAPRPDPYYRTISAAQGGVMDSYDDETGQDMASGGITSLGGYSDGGRMLKGPGDGMSDSIPGVIGGKQPARLADGEFVVPADVVSHLGNGSTDAGAKKLYSMMDKVRQARTGKKKQAPQVNMDKYLSMGKASGGIAGYASGGIVGYADGGEISSVYEMYLGRTPSAAEIKSWQDTGASYNTISQGIRNSPEATKFASDATNAEKIVTSIYQDQTGRAPDPDGLKFWSDAIRNGAPVSQISQGINQSLEGQNFDTQYITSLYRQNLARNPEQAGYQYWLSEAQAAGYTPKEIEAILKQAATPEQAKRDITGKTFTEMQLNALEADPYGGRYATKSIYDLLPDAVNVSTIGNQKAQFVNPVTQQPYVTNYGGTQWSQAAGQEILNTPQVQAAITVARNNGTLSTAGYTALLADLNAAKTPEQTRIVLAKPQAQVVVDALYGQQIGEDVSLAAAKAEAAKRQAVLTKQDPGYYQNNSVLTDAYKKAGETVPFDYNAYKDVDTRNGQANLFTPDNFQEKQNDLIRTLSTYKPTYQGINRNPLPASVRDPYSDEGLKVLYGQMMDQYGPPPEGTINPATEPYAGTYNYKPPMSTALKKEADAKAAYDAKVAADRLAYDKAGINESNFDAQAYLKANPDAGNRAIWQSTPYAHYVEANRLGDTRTATKLPFTPAPYVAPPLFGSTPAPAPVIGAAADGPIANRAGGLLSLRRSA
jgi:hypothetical protein